MVAIIAFSQNGIKIAKRLYELFEDADIVYRNDNLDNYIKDKMSKKIPLIFIGACGIAVRKIAPYIKDKSKDSPVIVIDEMAKYVIPILSGHLGGANELSLKIANFLDAECVITTATDLHNTFAVDVFAKQLSLAIDDLKKIKAVSAKSIRNETITILVDDLSLDKKLVADILKFKNNNNYNISIAIESDLSDKDNSIFDVVITDNENIIKKYKATIILRPKCYVVGMGCKKDKDFLSLSNFYNEILSANNIPSNRVGAIASIDIKQNEAGLIALANKEGIPLLTFSQKALNSLEGEFSSSNFVSNTVGVDNVCERAAAYVAGNNIVVKKTAKDGMTIAIARKEYEHN